MTDDQRVQMQMDHLEALSDAWAEEAKVTEMITNATSPMDLNANAPPDVRRQFHERMKSHIYDLMTQAFIEGAVRGIDLVNAELRTKR